MSDQLSECPPVLAEAFAKAVLAFENGHPRHEWRQISIPFRGHFSIVEVCGLVSDFNSRLPDHVFNKLRSYMHQHPDGELIAKLQAQPTYATAAECLRTMVKRASEG